MATLIDDTLRQQILDLVRDGINRALQPSTNGENLLDDSETSKLLGLAKGTLAVWRTKGKGPTFTKIGRNVRYRYEDIMAYLSDNRNAN